MGRKLAALLGKPPGAGPASRLPSCEEPPSGSGMRSLLRGYPPSSPPRHSRIPRGYLFGADLLLVATALMVMNSPAPLSDNEKFFGVVAVVLGASLGLIAICMRDHKEK
jgi:hypothetical protein